MNVQTFKARLDIDETTVWGERLIEFCSKEDDCPETVIIQSEALEELRQILLKSDASKASFVIRPCGVIRILSIPIENILPNKEKDLQEFGNNLIPYLQQLNVSQPT